MIDPFGRLDDRYRRLIHPAGIGMTMTGEVAPSAKVHKDGPQKVAPNEHQQQSLEHFDDDNPHLNHLPKRPSTQAASMLTFITEHRRMEKTSTNKIRQVACKHVTIHHRADDGGASKSVARLLIVELD